MEKSTKKENPIITLTDPYSRISEQFKQLRTKIFYAKNGTIPRTILITSALQGDGKTTIASNLAVSIAQGLSKHVLLVDCDLRKPSLHKKFSIQSESPILGLSDYLQKEDGLSNIIVKTDIDKLSIITAGTKSNNPVELIDSEKMAKMIKELKSRYEDRYIILDSTPVISTTEPHILSNLSDMIIFIVKSNKTPKELVKKSIDLIKKDKILGIVLNDVKRSPLKKKYDYYYTYQNKV